MSAKSLIGGANGPSLGFGIGLQAEGVDILPQEQQIAAQQQVRRENLAAKRKAQQEKQDELGLKSVTDGIIASIPHDINPLLQNKVEDAVTSWSNDIMDKYNNMKGTDGHDIGNFQIQGKARTLQLKSQVGSIKNLSDQYKINEAIDPNKLTQEGRMAQQAQNSTGDYELYMDKLDDISRTDPFHGTPFAAFSHNPDTGEVKLNPLKGVDFNKLFDTAAKNIAQTKMQSMGKVYEQDKPTEFLQFTPSDEDYAKQATAIVNSTPDGYSDWLRTVGRDNPSVFDKNGQLDKQASLKAYYDFVKQGLQANVQNKVREATGVSLLAQQRFLSGQEQDKKIQSADIQTGPFDTGQEAPNENQPKYIHQGSTSFIPVAPLKQSPAGNYRGFSTGGYYISPKIGKDAQTGAITLAWATFGSDGKPKLLRNAEEIDIYKKKNQAIQIPVVPVYEPSSETQTTSKGTPKKGETKESSKVPGKQYFVFANSLYDAYLSEQSGKDDKVRFVNNILQLQQEANQNNATSIYANSDALKDLEFNLNNAGSQQTTPSTKKASPTKDPLGIL